MEDVFLHYAALLAEIKETNKAIGRNPCYNGRCISTFDEDCFQVYENQIKSQSLL